MSNVNTNGVPIGRFGKFPDGTVALKISNGVDVTTATPQELIFDSTKNLFQVALTGNKVFSALSSITPSGTINQTFQVAHGVQGVPGYAAFAQVPNAGNSVLGTAAIPGLPTVYYQDIGPGGFFPDTTNALVSNFIFIGIDNTNLYITRQIKNGDSFNAWGASQITIIYFVYEQTIA